MPASVTFRITKSRVTIVAKPNKSRSLTNNKKVVETEIKAENTEFDNEELYVSLCKSLNSCHSLFLFDNVMPRPLKILAAKIDELGDLMVSEDDFRFHPVLKCDRIWSESSQVN